MIRFHSGKILTYDNQFKITGDEVWVDGSKIVYVGPQKSGKFDREINLQGNLLMPSFKNAHTHSAMTFARSYGDGLELQRWLNEKIFPLEAKLTSDDVYAFSQVAFLEYLTSGVSACFDMYYFPEAVAKSSTDLGFKTVMCGAVNDFKESAEKLEEYYNKYNSYNDLIGYRLGFHAEYTTSLELMKNISSLAQKYHAPVFMHSSETLDEVDKCIMKYGKTPTALFDELGLFNYGGGAFHSVWLSKKDVEIYKKRNVTAVLNAASNAKLASGVADVSKLINAGVQLAVGTDGASSNNALDMFREMYLISVVPNIFSARASTVSPESVLEAATIGSARCMGLTDCGTIAEGKKADLIVLDLNRPNMQPINDIIKNIVYSGSKDNVKMTMINGKILYENGEFTFADSEKIYHRAQKASDNLRLR